MALTLSTEGRAAEQGFGGDLAVRLKQAAEALVIPLGALLVSGVLFGLFIAALGKSPFELYGLMYKGGFGAWFSWQNTLQRAAPLLLTALCVVIPAQLGLVVIDGERALVLGGLAAAAIALTLQGAAPLAVQIGMALAAMTIGALWIGMVGALRHSRGVNETISSLLLAYSVMVLFNHIVEGPLRDPARRHPRERRPDPTAHGPARCHRAGAAGHHLHRDPSIRDALRAVQDLPAEGRIAMILASSSEAIGNHEASSSEVVGQHERDRHRTLGCAAGDPGRRHSGEHAVPVRQPRRMPDRKERADQSRPGRHAGDGRHVRLCDLLSQRLPLAGRPVRGRGRIAVRSTARLHLQVPEGQRHRGRHRAHAVRHRPRLLLRQAHIQPSAPILPALPLGFWSDVPQIQAALRVNALFLVGMVYQHFTLAPSMTVAENLVMARSECRR